MDSINQSEVIRAIGPDGQWMTASDLPSPDTKRWMATSKARVVAAVRAKLISFDDACERYRLSPEELFSWKAAIDRFGIHGLRATQYHPARCAPISAPTEVISEPLTNKIRQKDEPADVMR